MKNAVWTIFEQLYFEILRGVGKLEKAKPISVFIDLVFGIVWLAFWSMEVNPGMQTFITLWKSKVSVSKLKFKFRVGVEKSPALVEGLSPHLIRESILWCKEWLCKVD